MSGGVYTVKSDFPSLEKKLRDLGQLPTTVISRAAGKGATVVRRAARSAVPVRTGTMKRYITRAPERSKKKGKRVYRIGMKGGDEANEALQRRIKEPGKYGGKNKYAYYPSSTEYGWLGPNGKHEGSHWMQRASHDAAHEAEEAMVKEFAVQVDKAWAKKEAEREQNGF